MLLKPQKLISLATDLARQPNFRCSQDLCISYSLYEPLYLQSFDDDDDFDGTVLEELNLVPTMPSA
jgi:hypothetical protein